MTQLLTAAQMRAVERAAIDSGEVTGLELMERAGQGVVDAVMDEWPELAKTSHRALVLCGPGNNGGDGFVIARLLKQRGWQVEVFLYGDPDKLPPDAKVNYERWMTLGGVSELPKGFWLPKCDLHVDALFGTGLSRAISEDVSYSLTYLHKNNPHFRSVAVDVPSGLCADSGKSIGGTSGCADLTVTFHRRKRGHFLGSGAAVCGKIAVVDLGLPVPAFKSVDALMKSVNAKENPLDDSAHEALGSSTKPENEPVHLVDPVGHPRLVKRSFDLRKAEHHKFSHGHAVILSGPSGKTGAARLAARGALRIGAGLVTVGSPTDALTENAAQLTAIMLAEVDTPAALEVMLEDPRLNALCVGPGFGVERAAAFLPALLAAGRSLVLDADALTALAQNPELFAKLHKNCVLTPHAGEFKRLFPDLAEKLEAPATTGPAYSKVEATREAARRAGCVVLFKGPDTVIANPDGLCTINAALYERAAPWLATAGSGDVLAGFITGLLARGLGIEHAAQTAAYLHVDCALSFGPGLIAEDLPEQLPKVLRGLAV